MAKKSYSKLSIVIFFFLLLLSFYLFFMIPSTCENDFKTYPKKGYCEFTLETCEGIFGCKKYENVQAPCGSKSNLCGGEILCSCGDTNN